MSGVASGSPVHRSRRRLLSRSQGNACGGVVPLASLDSCFLRRTCGVSGWSPCGVCRHLGDFYVSARSRCRRRCCGEGHQYPSVSHRFIPAKVCSDRNTGPPHGILTGRVLSTKFCYFRSRAAGFSTEASGSRGRNCLGSAVVARGPAAAQRCRRSG